MKKIDVRGLSCPKPVLEVKNALEKLPEGEFEVIVNSKESKENILRFLTANNIKADVKEDNSEYIITFKGAHVVKGGEEVIVCNTGTFGKSYVVSRDRLGEGDEKLGKILIRSFIHTLTELKPLPKSVFFVNSGVFLTLKESPVLEELVKLSEKGVKIFSCGTCLDYYNKKSELSVGEVGNMYQLVEILSENGCLI